MKLKIIRKELYRIPISKDIVNEVYELGVLEGKRRQIPNWIIYNLDLSSELKNSWCEQYMKEFILGLRPVSDKLREKLKMEELDNIIAPDFKRGELVILDITRDEYEKL